MKKRTSVKKAGRIIIIAVCALALWISAGVTDYVRVFKFRQKPIFTFVRETADDGGSGFYYGLGYSFAIEGNFMPEDIYKGITRADFILFGARTDSFVIMYN